MLYYKVEEDYGLTSGVYPHSELLGHQIARTLSAFAIQEVRINHAIPIPLEVDKVR